MAEQMRYTPGPWQVVEKGRGWRDPRRIVACVNACDGISTEALEAGVIRDLIDLMAEILRGLEWSGWDEEFLAPICPVCGAYKRKNKHFPDCDLNKALSLLRGVA